MAHLFARSKPSVGTGWLFFLACCLLLLTRLGALGFVYQGLDRMLEPLWHTVHVPVAIYEQMAHRWRSHQNLAQQNAVLAVERQVLAARVKRLEASIKENRQLRDLLSSTDRIKGSFITTDLLAVLHRSEGQEWIINRGKDSQVYVGQPVLDASGIVGQIISVGNHSSRLLPLTDDRVYIPVENTSGAIKAMVQGAGHRRMKLLYVPDSSPLKVGDVLLASGLGLQFPRGYPVGRVLSVRAVSGSDFSDVDVEPIATLALDRILLLVWSDLTPAEKEAKKWLAGESR